MTNSRLGGSDHRVAPGGPGSSPGCSTFPATNNRKTLKRMLRSRDKILSQWDRMDRPKRWHIYGMSLQKIDNERKLIRAKLKSFNKETHESKSDTSHRRESR